MVILGNIQLGSRLSCSNAPELTHGTAKISCGRSWQRRTWTEVTNQQTARISNSRSCWTFGLVDSCYRFSAILQFRIQIKGKVEHQFSWILPNEQINRKYIEYKKKTLAMRITWISGSFCSDFRQDFSTNECWSTFVHEMFFTYSVIVWHFSVIAIFKIWLQRQYTTL